MSISTSGLELWDTVICHVWRPLADDFRQWYLWISSSRQRLSPCIRKAWNLNSKWEKLEKMGIKVGEMMRLFRLCFFRARMLPCKLPSVQSCMENFCCIITGTIKEITGYRNWGSGTPQILYRGAESYTNWVFRKNCILSTRLAFLLFTPYFYFRFGLNYMSGTPFCF